MLIRVHPSTPFGATYVQPRARMPAKTLTDVAIRKLKPTAGRQVDVYDSNVRGLALRVSPSGTKTFVIWYRIGGKARRLTLGRFPLLQLADARQRAKAALIEVADGKDPAAERQRARVEYGDSPILVPSPVSTV